MCASPARKTKNRSEQLKELRAEGLYRELKTSDSDTSLRVILENGESLINFCSNDYLNLSRDPEVLEALSSGAKRFGVGSTASPLVCGRSSAHAELETNLADYTSRDRAIVFSSGYLANLALIGSFATDRRDVVFQDKLNHASLLDAVSLGCGKLVRYKHCDNDNLEQRISAHKELNPFLVTEAVFSMDGDVAPLNKLADTAKKHNVDMAVDEAHSFGLFGDGGVGMLRHCRLGQAEVPLMMATFGKALGCAGAFVAGPKEMIEFMVQKARPYIYSTALSPAMAVAATKSLELVRTQDWRREKLFTLIDRFKTGAKRANLPLCESSSPIQPLIVGSANLAMEIGEDLQNKGMLVTAIRPPTVPANTSRLRVTISAGHSNEDVDLLLSSLEGAFTSKGIVKA